MYAILASEEFSGWLRALRDERAKARIAARIRSAEFGNFGDTAAVGSGVSEMRIHFGPGYRVYYTRTSETVYVLLIGGDKSSQKGDIAKAKELARVARMANP